MAQGGILTVASLLLMRETNPKVILGRIAHDMRKITKDKRYTSKLADANPVPLYRMVARALRRPLLLLFTNPVVSLLSIYLAMVSGYIVSRHHRRHHPPPCEVLQGTSNNSSISKVHILSNPSNSLQGEVRLFHKHSGAGLRRSDGRLRSGRRPQRHRHGQNCHAIVREERP